MPSPLPNAKLFSYVVARDYGFAPNPFHGFCTLATCKPKIRNAAGPGDWIVGTGSKRNGLDGHIIYAMRVSEVMPFNDYWLDPRFHIKRPNLHASRSRAYGDNIYHQDDSGAWQQADSHHSCEDGSPNASNVRHDTRVNRVLIAKEFIYWGSAAPELPLFAGIDIRKKGPGHKCNFPVAVIQAFADWLHTREQRGYCGDPIEW